MTDDQLLRAATRIRHLVIGHAKDNCVHMHYIFRAFTAKAGDELEAAIKAILREEMDKEPERPPLTETLRALYDICPEKFDDPTKSFVLTTDG